MSRIKTKDESVSSVSSVVFCRLVIACAVSLLAACSTPAPEVIIATPSPSGPATFTPALPPPTATPTATPEPTATPVPYRAIVRARGKVVCGIDSDRPDLAGFDADVCRAIAAALFDDPDAVDVRLLDWAAAATALVSGEIDVVLGPTDRELPGIHLGPTLFVDATGAIARTDVGIRTIADLKFTTVCLVQDSIDEQVFNEAAQAARVQVQPFLFNAGDADAMYSRYDQGHCDALVDNRVRLAQRLPALSAPREQALIDLTLPTGRRGLLSASGDANWIDIVSAIGSSLIRAEELGVVSSNLDDAPAGDDPAIRQLLGVEGDGGARLGLARDFARRAIAHVGNYGEIYDRHFGGLPRGPNALVQDGGMISAP